MLVNIANAQVALGADVDVILINDHIDKALVNRFSPNVNIHVMGRKVGSKSMFGPCSRPPRAKGNARFRRA